MQDSALFKKFYEVISVISFPPLTSILNLKQSISTCCIVCTVFYDYLTFNTTYNLEN